MMNERLCDEHESEQELAAGAVLSRGSGQLLLVDAGHERGGRRYCCARPKGSLVDVLLYCTGGRGWLRLDEQRFDLQSGDLVAIPSGVAHAYGGGAKDAFEFYWLGIRGALTSVYRTALCNDPQRPIIEVGSDPLLISLFAELVDLLSNDQTRTNSSRTADVEPGAPAKRRSFSNAIDRFYYGPGVATNLLNAILRRKQKGTGPLPPANERVAASIEFMEQNLEQGVGIALLCRMTRLSPSYYTALFRQQTGRSPLDYFVELRMRRAAFLLDSTTQTVQDIAAQVGYKDHPRFLRLFVQTHGMSPEDYRRREPHDHGELDRAIASSE